MKQKNPSTSHEAHLSMIPVIPSHHQKILEALHKNGEGIYEDIAKWCGFKDKNSVSRRLLELEKIFVVEKTERKKATSTGRMAFVYRMHPKFIYEPVLSIHQQPPKSDTSCLTDGTEVLDGEKWLWVKDDAPKTEKNQVIQQSLFK